MDTYAVVNARKQRPSQHVNARKQRPSQHVIAAIWDRFWPKVRTGDGCWEWQASRTPFGYGQLRVGERPAGAHRLSWELSVGPIPAGNEVCHACDNPPCVRPSHLFLGTHADNMRDAAAKGKLAKPYATVCSKGHPFAGANLRVNLDGRSACRACGREAARRYRARLAGRCDG